MRASDGRRKVSQKDARAMFECYDPGVRTASRRDPATARSETFPYSQQTFALTRGELTGARVMYFDSGASKKPVLLLVHGLGCNLTHFEYIAPLLEAAGFRVIGLDLPGFGLSSKPHGRYTIRFLSDAIIELLDELHIDRASLCGHSLGGLVCADLALHSPERVERLILLSSAGFFRMPLAVRLAARTILRPGLLAPALEHGARRLLGRALSETNERTERFIEQSVSRPDPRFVRDLARVMWSLRDDLTSYTLLDVAKRLETPTLVIWGGRDKLLPFGRVPGWVRELRTGEMEIIERCGHMPHIENPVAVAHRVREFLGRRYPTSSRPYPTSSHPYPPLSRPHSPSTKPPSARLTVS